MSNRSAKFVSAIFAGILAGASFSALAENAPQAVDNKVADNKAADNCLSGPNGGVPAGSHWYYRIERTTKRHCWYLGEEKDKTAKAAPAAQDASSPADAAAQPVPPQQTTSLRKSVADARAELPSPQSSVAPDTAAGTDQRRTNDASADNSQRAPAPDAGAQSSTISARWPDASSVSSSSDPRLAASGPPASAQADAQPEPPPAVTPVALAAADSADRQSSSTQMLLLVMAGALALAGLIGAVMLRLSRARKPPYEIEDEWRAPWDSVRTDRPLPPTFPRRDMPMRDRDTESPMRRAAVSRDPRTADDADRRIAEMLQRLARSATS